MNWFKKFMWEGISVPDGWDGTAEEYFRLHAPRFIAELKAALGWKRFFNPLWVGMRVVYAMLPRQ